MRKSRYLAFTALLIVSSTLAEESDPLYDLEFPGETFSATRLNYLFSGEDSSFSNRTALGIDDTLNQFRCTLPASTPLAAIPPTSQVRIETDDNGDGITRIRVIHQSSLALSPRDRETRVNSGQIRFASANILSFTAYRTNSDISPIRFAASCRMTDFRMKDPSGGTSDATLDLTATLDVSLEEPFTSLEHRHGRVRLDSNRPAPNNLPQKSGDFISTSSPEGGGSHLVTSYFSADFTVAYRTPLVMRELVEGRITASFLDPSDFETWELGTNGEISFTIWSADPDVRFEIHTKQDPVPIPDLLIGKTPTSLKGGNIRTASPSGIQTVAFRQRKSRRNRIYFRLENDGPAPCGGTGKHSIRFRGPRKTKSDSLRYFDSVGAPRRNITAQCAAGSYCLEGGFAGTATGLLAEVKAKRQSRFPRRSKRNIVFSSTNPAAGGTDRVRARVVKR